MRMNAMEALQTRTDAASPDRGPLIVAQYWVWAAVSMILVSLRLYVRRKMHILGWDDLVMFITLLIFLISCSLGTYYASIGGFRSMHDLNHEELVLAIKWSWLVQPPVILVFGFAKASICLFMLRLIGQTTRWRRYGVYGVLFAVLFGNAVAVLITFVQCTPVYALWTKGMEGSCWSPLVQEHYNFALGAVNIATDVALAVLPMTFIPKLKLSRATKIVLCTLLGLGVSAAVAGGVKVSYLVILAEREADFTWEIYNVFAWSAAEGFIIMFCGNLPALQPLWGRFITRELDSSFRRRSHDLAQIYNRHGSGTIKSSSLSHSRNPSSSSAQVQVQAWLDSTEMDLKAVDPDEMERQQSMV